ncbi:MAG: hypothetical protein P1R74_12965 [Sedimenticola sp.]|nr:hypothetical protein [Sedimenticola sp.]
MDKETLIRRIEGLTDLGTEALLTKYTTSMNSERLELTSFYKFRSASMSFILKLFGKSHPYYKEFMAHTKNAHPSSAYRGIGMLSAIQDEVELGWLNSTRSLISADIFGDFLEMAEHLLEEKYKDPAAVLAGSALEQHLKNLALSNGVKTTYDHNGKEAPKKADVLNADLVKAGVYTKTDQKSITSWLDIRNNAAHGKFAEYNDEQVKFMLMAISEFMGRVSV